MKSTAFSRLVRRGCARSLVAAALLVPSVAGAATSRGSSPNQIDNVRLDLHADVGGYASFGAGFRVDIPIVRSGLIATANDELAISPGVDVFFANFNEHYYSGGPYLVPNIVLQWNFYLNERWSIFPEAGLAFYVGDGDELPRGRATYAALDLGFGARYHWAANRAFLMRVSSPTGLQLGVTF
jgi:hypothetical protein